MNSFGKLYRVSIFGESHGNSVGILIDGLKPGIKVNYELINQDLERRKPNYVGSTPRKEADEFIIESGVFNDVTTGSPLLIRFLNMNVKSADYNQFQDVPRPSHTDYTATLKYGQSLPGSGHFSGRLTLGLVAAGSFAKMMLPLEISSKFIQVGTLKDLSKLDEYIAKVTQEHDSVGAVVEITVKNPPKGLGEPFFESVESKLSQMLYSVPGVKGVSFGVGFDGINLLGSQFNDPIIDSQGHTKSNHSGGINGGITNGNDLVIKVFVRPAASISKPQETFNFKTNQMESLVIEGRHDAFIAKRALVVLENAVMIGLYDLYKESYIKG